MNTKSRALLIRAMILGMRGLYGSLTRAVHNARWHSYPYTEEIYEKANESDPGDHSLGSFIDRMRRW